MAKTVIGLFDSAKDAQGALRDALGQGFQREDVSVITLNRDDPAAAAALPGHHEGLATGASAGALLGGVAGLLVGLGVLAIPGIGPVLAAGPLATTLAGAGIGAATGSLIGALADLGVPEEDARLFEEGVRRGGTLVLVRSSDEQAAMAARTLEQHGAVDIVRRGGSITDIGQRDQQSKEASMADQSKTKSESKAEDKTQAASQTTTQTTGASSAVAVPVIEEQLAVGKREVDRGGVRVYTHVTERPVTETINLREEAVHVERRPVDRPVSPEALAAFKEGTIEVRAHAEEAVVAKQARVVEEVVVQKDVAQRTEAIHETLRRTDVAVENVPGTRSAGPVQKVHGFESFNDDFRRHYSTTFARTGMTYEQYTPAYRYGFELANEPRYRGRSWQALESDAQSAWDRKNPGTWDRFKDAVRHAWERVTGGPSQQQQAAT